MQGVCQMENASIQGKDFSQRFPQNTASRSSDLQPACRNVNTRGAIIGHSLCCLGRFFFSLMIAPCYFQTVFFPYSIFNRSLCMPSIRRNWTLYIVLLFVMASASQLWAASFIKSPYLMYTGIPGQMQVLWQLDGAASCTVSWGTSTAYGQGSVQSTEYNANHQHKQMITGLAPSQSTYYKVQISGGSAVTGQFLAAPPSSDTSLKFFAYGDTRTNPLTNDLVCQKMLAEVNADPALRTFVLHVGDWVTRGDDDAMWTNEWFTPSASNLRQLAGAIPIQGCRGNHEDTGVVFEQYFPYPYIGGRGYWSYDYGPVHIANLDQYDVSGGPSTTQLNWLKQDLANTKKQWKFLVYHEPAWSANGGHGSNAKAQTVIQPICKQYGVDICFGGHNHFYARCAVDGVQHLTIGGGGAPLATPSPSDSSLVTYAKANHYTKIEINGRRLDFKAIATNGSTLDSFTIIHPAPSSVKSKTWSKLASMK